MFSLRMATAEDAEALAELGRRTFFEAFAKDNTPEDMARCLTDTFSPALQRKEILTPSVRFLLLLADGELAGYAKLRPAAPNARGQRPLEVHRFYVDRPWHGSGAAHTLMEAVLAHARANAHDEVWLAVWERNARAIRFYSKFGFTRVGEQPFQLGQDVQTDWVMARAVTPEQSR